MMTNEELKQISGGGISVAAGVIIVAGLSFLIGVIDGFCRPYACNNGTK